MSSATTTTRTLLVEAARILERIGVEDEVAVRAYRYEGRLHLVFDVISDVVTTSDRREELLRSLTEGIGARFQACDYEDGTRLAFGARLTPEVTYSAHARVIPPTGATP